MASRPYMTRPMEAYPNMHPQISQVAKKRTRISEELPPVRSAVGTRLIRCPQLEGAHLAYLGIHVLECVVYHFIPSLTKFRVDDARSFLRKEARRKNLSPTARATTLSKLTYAFTPTGVPIIMIKAV